MENMTTKNMTTRTAMKPEAPIYRKTANYAYEAGELVSYRASLAANEECREAIEAAISSNYGDNRLDADAAVKSVLEQFSPERVRYVLANTIQQKDFDERVPQSLKEWAKTVDVCPEKASRFIVDKPNPGLTALFVDAFRQQTEAVKDATSENATEERDPEAVACENDEIASNLVRNYVKTLHQRSNDARHMSICEKVNEAKYALIKERDELESKCNAYDTYVSLCCERGGSYDAFYSFSDSLYDSIRNEMLKHVNDDDEYDSVYDSIRELSDSDVVAMYIELFEADEAEVFRRLDSARDELRDAVINEIEYMTDYDESETLHELRNALAEDEKSLPENDPNYRLLDRLRVDCEYFLGAGNRAEKHLWAGSVYEQVVKMRELYDALPQKPEWLTKEMIEDYADRMAPQYQVVVYHHFENSFDEKQDYQTLKEAEKAAQGYVDGTMESDGFAYDGAAIYDQQARKYLRIYGDYPDERAHAEVAGCEQTAHKLVTYADWEAAGSFEKAANLGDYVEERIIDEMRDCLPPACMNSGFLQMGEPYSHELDPDTGKWKPTFMTFKKDGQHWTYCGNCFYKQDTPPKSERRH